MTDQPWYERAREVQGASDALSLVKDVVRVWIYHNGDTSPDACAVMDGILCQIEAIEEIRHLNIELQGAEQTIRSLKQQAGETESGVREL